ncbi:MAG: hypothetical protein CME60_05560 [Halobacteriovoraceae bacterium]|nr:hypothetical protein [Halobacteriovoraceae bacterium]|tara:strand:- start:405 stop:704 length:300 start_codon:yes stop_codon:yes gene_type:complete
MKLISKLIILFSISLSSQAFFYEIEEIVTRFDMCSDAIHPEIFKEMYAELQVAYEADQDLPFYVDMSRYTFEFESETRYCDVYVDPYDWRCYTPVCENK